MPAYVDGFVIPIRKDNLAEYRRVARAAGKIWKEHGALAYMECVGDDMEAPGCTAFTKLAKAKSDETVLFSWAVFKTRAARDKANTAIMKDPRMKKLGEDSRNIINPKRMAYGGFKAIVEM